MIVWDRSCITWTTEAEHWTNFIHKHLKRKSFSFSFKDWAIANYGELELKMNPGTFLAHSRINFSNGKLYT